MKHEDTASSLLSCHKLARGHTKLARATRRRDLKRVDRPSQRVDFSYNLHVRLGSAFNSDQIDSGWPHY
jgi:hypothetical protein